MVHDFEKIDFDKDSKLSWDELKVFNGGTAEWLEHQLDGIVGLSELKAMGWVCTGGSLCCGPLVGSEAWAQSPKGWADQR